MDFVAFPSWWTVTLRNGGVVQLFADGYSDEGGTLTFSALVDASDDEQAAFEVTGRTPSNPRRVIVSLAKVPASSVVEVNG